LPFGTNYTLAFSRILYPREVLVAYNVSNQPRSDCVLVDAMLHRTGEPVRFLYGSSGSVAVNLASDGTKFVKLNLAPRQFVVLES
jgi:hypothetical protein